MNPPHAHPKRRRDTRIHLMGGYWTPAELGGAVAAGIGLAVLAWVFVVFAAAALPIQ